MWTARSREMEGRWKAVKICTSLLIPLSIVYVILTPYIPDQGPYIHSAQTEQSVIASPAIAFFTVVTLTL
jgi:hypothetical protein